GYGRHVDVRVLAVYGGQPYGPQIGQLKRGVDVVVGTPGRLLDLIKRRVLDLAEVTTVVLDEADEMLSMGFVEDIEAILAHTPAARQTTLFSATIPAEIRRLAGQYLSDPQTVTIAHKQLTVAGVEQRAYLVHESDKLAALTRLFEVEEISSALIFSRTRVSTGQLANELTQRGFPAESLNGDLSQDAREQVLGRFRRNQIKVLVATDVAARGLDIDDISHVFNYDLPQDREVYVHRVGRTGRAGKTGIAISLVTPRERWRMQRLESYTRQRIDKATLPSKADIEARREEALQERMMVWLERDRCRREKDMVEALVEQGFDPVSIAAAALKLARDDEKQRPIAPVKEVKASDPQRSQKSNGRSRYGRKQGNGQNNGRRSDDRFQGKKSHEKGMVRLTMNAGKVQGVRPNDVVGTLAYQADIPGKTIGAIRIQDQHTLVDVPERYVAQVLAKNGDMKIHRQAIVIERA
ncbi:MAG: DEAD/DEAH box helicase, partial [Chloroflexota bacterium]